jgi:hypothetical protein
MKIDDKVPFSGGVEPQRQGSAMPAKETPTRDTELQFAIKKVEKSELLSQADV